MWWCWEVHIDAYDMDLFRFSWIIDSGNWTTHLKMERKKKGLEVKIEGKENFFLEQRNKEMILPRWLTLFIRFIINSICLAWYHVSLGLSITSISFWLMWNARTHPALIPRFIIVVSVLIWHIKEMKTCSVIEWWGNFQRPVQKNGRNIFRKIWMHNSINKTNFTWKFKEF